MLCAMWPTVPAAATAAAPAAVLPRNDGDILKQKPVSWEKKNKIHADAGEFAGNAATAAAEIFLLFRR